MSTLLNSLKKDLKILLAKGRQDELFRRLREEVLRDSSVPFNDAILLEANWNDSQRKDNLGTVTFEHANVSFASLGKALTWLINRIEEGDLSEQYRRITEDHVFIPSRARFYVDRSEQTEEFELLEYDPPQTLLDFHNGKVRFFYLHGDLRQMHQDLVNRIGNERTGAWIDFSQGGYDPEREPIVESLKPRPSTNPKIFPIRVISGLLKKFDLPAQPTSTKRLRDLLSSNKLAGKGKEDLVFILLSIDDFNWDKNTTPALVRALYENFCNCELDPNAPSFYFFFGIEYSKENQTIQREVAAAMDQAQYGIPLPKLEPVSIQDLGEWFSQIKSALRPGSDPEQLARNLFPGQDTIDMADIVIALEKFINTHNNGLMFKDE